MAGMYSLNDLLELSLREGAEELRLRTGEAPVMIIQGEATAIDVPAVTTDNVTELFHSIATEGQLEELRRCGDIHFIYAFQGFRRFGVTAKMQRESFAVQFRNLSPRG